MTREIAVISTAVHPHGRGEHFFHRLVLIEEIRFIPTGVGNTPACPSRNKTSSVHPHGRGEHGSQFVRRVRLHRFIPTGVGNTASAASPIDSPAVHPHGRGEHRAGRIRAEPVRGSSPRAWGTPAGDPDGVVRGRFIPTGVGNTVQEKEHDSAKTVHPHGRGEHVGLRANLAGVVRFIPTGVGNTLQERSYTLLHSVHPHGRGEHLTVEDQAEISRGSSPRAWGTLQRPVAAQDPHRFIPTGVGNTCVRCRCNSPTSVHPHGRGEHGRPGTRPRRRCGSSPRAWGTPVDAVAAVARRRFIPTGVGNTMLTCCKRNLATVHPHGRGEHASRATPRRCRPGSSPRAWGTPPMWVDWKQCHRFIPTGVGNTAER